LNSKNLQNWDVSWGFDEILLNISRKKCHGIPNSGSWLKNPTRLRGTFVFSKVAITVYGRCRGTFGAVMWSNQNRDFKGCNWF
jgi:hypothetical protein